MPTIGECIECPAPSLTHETAHRKKGQRVDSSDRLDALDCRRLDRSAFCGAHVTPCSSVFAVARSAHLGRDDHRDPFRAAQAWSPHGVCNSGGPFVVRLAQHISSDKNVCDYRSGFLCVSGLCRSRRISSVVCSIKNCFNERRDNRHVRCGDCSCTLRRVTSEKAGCAKVGFSSKNLWVSMG
jgi:hypothetical protein